MQKFTDGEISWKILAAECNKDWRTRPNNFRRMNAHVITIPIDNMEYFYSYSTLVAVKVGEKYYFNKKTYSTTTSCQITAWCGINTAARRKGIKSGLYGTF